MKLPHYPISNIPIVGTSIYIPPISGSWENHLLQKCLAIFSGICDVIVPWRVSNVKKHSSGGK